MKISTEGWGMDGWGEILTLKISKFQKHVYPHSNHGLLAGVFAGGLKSYNIDCDHTIKAPLM